MGWTDEKGVPDPDALLARMPNGLWQEWQILFRLEPWGGRHEDLRTGLLASILHGQWSKKGRPPTHWFPSLRDKKKRRKPNWRRSRDNVKVMLMAEARQAGR